MAAGWAGGERDATSACSPARGRQDHTYAGADDAKAAAWTAADPCATSHPPCGKRRNGFGLCDMSGNVWERTGDGYAGDQDGDGKDDYYAVSPGTDPAGAAAGATHRPRAPAPAGRPEA